MGRTAAWRRATMMVVSHVFEPSIILRRPAAAREFPRLGLRMLVGLCTVAIVVLDLGCVSTDPNFRPTSATGSESGQADSGNASVSTTVDTGAQVEGSGVSGSQDATGGSGSGLESGSEFMGDTEASELGDSTAELSDTDDGADEATNDVGDESPAVCGDGEISGSEVCEPGDPEAGRGPLLAGESCESLEFDSGTLDCTRACVFDTALCQRCGDGLLQGFEACDGDELNGKQCTDFANIHGQMFDRGELACSDSCQFDGADCSLCGDDVIQADELCDGTALGENSCQSEGFDGGVLTCASDCASLMTEGCTRCGDGEREGTEQCDGNDLDGASCASLLGGGSGTLNCDASCNYDTSACTLDACGDSVVNGPDECDCGMSEGCTAEQLGGETCISRGFDGGSLACHSPASCLFDESGCYRCGDGQVNPGESCDGDDLAGQSCISLGFTSGSLACDSQCGFDSSGCSGVKQVRVCSDGPSSIPPLSSSSDAVFIAERGSIVDMSVELKVSHVWISGLHIQLWSVLRQDLINRPGIPNSTFGCRVANIDTVLSDDAPRAAEQVCGPGTPAIRGHLRPNDPFTTFVGSDAYGLWTLSFADDMNAAGTVESWCLTIEYE